MVVIVVVVQVDVHSGVGDGPRHSANVVLEVEVRVVGKRKIPAVAALESCKYGEARQAMWKLNWNLR